MANHEERSAFDELREAFAARTGTDAADWFAVFKARYGMREVFRALREAHGAGEVVTTLFTGCTAVDAILAAGLRATYAPVNPDTLGVDASALPSLVGPQTRAVLWQHSYGIVDAEECAHAAELAHGADALLVEDSAHSVARMARDATGAPVADVSIHSFGIEKTFSNLYFGGMIWVSPAMADVVARERMVEALSVLPELPPSLDAATRRYRNQVRVLTRLPEKVARIMRGRLLASGSYEPPVADVERRGGLPYESYLPSEWIVRQILPMLATLDEDEARRRACVALYREALGDVDGLRVPSAALACVGEQPLIRFPVTLPDERLATQVRQALLSAGLYAVDWYRVPFYPGALDLGAYGVVQGDYDAYRARYGGTIGLPTDVESDRVPEAAEVVRRQLVSR